MIYESITLLCISIILSWLRLRLWTYVSITLISSILFTYLWLLKNASITLSLLFDVRVYEIFGLYIGYSSLIVILGLLAVYISRKVRGNLI